MFGLEHCALAFSHFHVIHRYLYLYRHYEDKLDTALYDTLVVLTAVPASISNAADITLNQLVKH